jgi:hypothetical protein
VPSCLNNGAKRLIPYSFTHQRPYDVERDVICLAALFNLPGKNSRPKRPAKSLLHSCGSSQTGRDISTCTAGECRYAKEARRAPRSDMNNAASCLFFNNQNMQPHEIWKAASEYIPIMEKMRRARSTLLLFRRHQKRIAAACAMLIRNFSKHTAHILFFTHSRSSSQFLCIVGECSKGFEGKLERFRLLLTSLRCRKLLHLSNCFEIVKSDFFF